MLCHIIIIIFAFISAAYGKDAPPIQRPSITADQAYQQSFDQIAMKKLFAEVQNSFTFLGAPISPEVLQSLAPFAGDKLQAINSIDLNAAIVSNRFTKNFYNKTNLICGQKTYGIKTDDGQNLYDYAVIGRLDNNMPVIFTRYSEAGNDPIFKVQVIKLEMATVFDSFYYTERLFNIDLPYFAIVADRAISKYDISARTLYSANLPFIDDSCSLKGNIISMNRPDLGKKYSIDLNKIAQLMQL